MDNRIRRKFIVAAGIGALMVALLPGQATAAPPDGVTFAVANPVYTIAEGSNARVGITVTTADGTPLAAPATVAYRTTAGTAGAGSDFTPAQGQITFATGTASGDTKF